MTRFFMPEAETPARANHDPWRGKSASRAAGRGRRAAAGTRRRALIAAS
jgi:hypothetical protein